jgi:5'-nucleotidase
MPQQRPLILIGNDDGIASPGLEALVRATYPLGDILVAAPRSPYSSAGRSFIWGSREIEERPWPLPGVTAYAVDAAPAITIHIAIEALAPRRPDLMLSGINLGENVGTDVTLSGTIGAAIEAAICGVPSVAISLEAPVEYHDNPRPGLDFSGAAAVAGRLAQALLALQMPQGVDLLKVDVPAGAGPETPWAITRISRQRYWQSIVQSRPGGKREILGYERRVDLSTLEPDSDIHALLCRRAISVSPMTVDLTGPLDAQGLGSLLTACCGPLQDMRSVL